MYQCIPLSRAFPCFGLSRGICGEIRWPVHSLTAGPGEVFTRAIERMFEYRLFPMMLEVLLW